MVRISVVIATFNAAGLIQSAINNFNEQTYVDKELLVADGCSNDGTLSILELNSSSIAWYTSERDNGIFHAWNKCIAEASGDWLYFMGADDGFVSPAVLEEAASMLDLLPARTLVAYGLVNLVDSSGSLIETIGGPWDAEGFRHRGMTIPHQGCFTRRSYFTEYGTFDISQSSTATYELYLRHLKSNDAVFLPQIPIGAMGVGGVSTRPENQLKFLNAYTLAQRRHGVFKLTLRLFFDYTQALVKALLFRILPYNLALEIIERLRVAGGKKRHFKTPRGI